MRRIIHNTTAIAACLSLLAPHLAMAQTETPAAETAEQAAPAPETCADGSALPCATEPAAEAEVEAEVTPAEPAAAVEEAAPEEAPAEEAPAEAAAETEAEAAPAEAATAEAEATTEAPAAEEEAPAEAAPVAEAEAPAQPQATTTEAPAAEAAPAAEPAIAPAPTDADALKAALAAEEAKATAETPAAEAEAEAKPEAEAAPAADALKAALAAKEAEAAAETPAAEAKPETTEAATTKAAAEVAPEADAKETEAAKEAAAAVAAPVAAALSAGAGEGEVTEEKVTEDNSRSSSEDFATNLSDALAGTAAAQDAKDDDDDDKKDLAKALLLGLGGVAVGAMLANNRQVALSSPDRVVVTRPDGSQQVIKDEVALLRQPGSTVTTENFADGSSRTIVTRADGSQVVTIRDADLRVLRRTLVTADGRTQDLIDDTAAQPVDIASLPKPAATNRTTASQMDEAQLRDALMVASAADRRFTLSQIRDIAQVRSLVAPVNIDSITFDTGSAAIKSDQAEQLSALGKVIRDSIAENPGEMFMIEGYTDTVGSDAANLALSDRRAESVALALTEYFDVPPENMVVQGYGEEFLLVNREGDLRENRRASVRRITELLQTASN